QIQLRQYAASHNPFLNNVVHHPMITRMEHNRYIGPTAKFKEFFVFLTQKSPVNGVKRKPHPTYREISDPARFATLVAYLNESNLPRNDLAQLRQPRWATRPKMASYISMSILCKTGPAAAIGKRKTFGKARPIARFG